MRSYRIGGFAAAGLAVATLVGCDSSVENPETVTGIVSRVDTEDHSNIVTFLLEGDSFGYYCVKSYVIECGFLEVNEKVTVTAGHKTDGERHNYVTQLILNPPPS